MKAAFLIVLFVLIFPVNTYAASLYDLGTLNNQPSSYAYSINNQGAIVGSTKSYGEGSSTALIWKNGVVSALPPLPGGIWAYAFDINDRGQVVGVSSGLFNGSSQAHATLWDQGKPIDLGDVFSLYP